jgi:hypothetical protein
VHAVEQLLLSRLPLRKLRGKAAVLRAQPRQLSVCRARGELLQQRQCVQPTLRPDLTRIGAGQPAQPLAQRNELGDKHV